MIKLGIDVDGVDSDGYELHWAKEGDLEPLAELIEECGDLGPETQKWLAAYLRGEVSKKRGNKRRRSQIEHEERVVRVIRDLQQYNGKFWLAIRRMSPTEMRRLQRNEEDQERFFKDTRGKISENAAVNLYLDLVEDAPPRETVRTYLRKYKRRYPHLRW